jgi:hypothetical protein
MSFLDNLKSNLKIAGLCEEGREVSDRLQRPRESERAGDSATCRATEEVCIHEMLAGWSRGYLLRAKVHVAWLGNTLRLEARDRRLELRPTVGILAVSIESGNERLANNSIYLAIRNN